MQIDDLNDEISAPNVQRDLSDSDSFAPIPIDFEMSPEQSAAVSEEPEGARDLSDSDSFQAITVAPVPAVEEPAPAPVKEELKTCCICGLDLSSKERSRDRAGRLWCGHCNNFTSETKKITGMTTPCPSCGRESRPLLMVERAGEKICQTCDQESITDGERRLVHREKVTFNPEVEIRKIIRQMVYAIIGIVVLAILTPLYHHHLLYFRPRDWVPYESAFYFCGIMTVVVSAVIVFQFMRIAVRKRERLAAYDRMVQDATNHVLALDDDSHTMGISESPEPLRRRVERAILRIEACGGLGMPEAHKIIETLSKHSDALPMIAFLRAQRPSTNDTVARNREIATISYLQVDLNTAGTAVTAILLRLPNDQDAMTRQALICFRNGQLEEAKKIFKRVIFVAREKNSQVDLAAAFCNLGMLHVMLNEFDDGGVRYSQAMHIFTKLDREDGQADCLLNLGLIAFKCKKWNEVEDQLRKAMAINRRLNRREGLAICCSLLGVILEERETKEPNEEKRLLTDARKLLTEAVKLNLELGRAGGVAAAYGNLGLVSVKQENFEDATQQLMKALAIYQRIKRPKMILKIQGMMKTVNNLNAQKIARGK